MPLQLLLPCIPQVSNILSDTVDVIALQLKSSNIYGGIDTNNAHRLTKQTIYLLMSVPDLEHHINHEIHLITIIFFCSAFCVKQVNECLLHIKKFNVSAL